MLGPYQAQKILAGREVREGVEGCLEREGRVMEDEEGGKGVSDGETWRKAVERAGQRVPVLDLWVGRHECVYSRVFNS